MFEKVRQPWRAKNVVAIVLFGAIILVFALFGISPDKYGSSTGGGVAAVVDGTTISVREYNQRVKMDEYTSKLKIDQFPQAQREMIQKEMRRRSLEQMIAGEVIYQSAFQHGIVAPDSEVREYLMNAFQDKDGKFVRARYDDYLSRTEQSPDQFEYQVRKEIVGRRLQEMFSAALMPVEMEIEQVADLRSRQVNIRLVELTPAKLATDKGVSDSEVDGYLKDASHEAVLKKYYDEHMPDYILEEKVRARHILLSVDAKHTDKEMAAKAKALRAQLNGKNFAAIATKESQDPGSAKKGGDLGYFEKGRMVPQFEAKAFAMKAGEISEPVKSDFGYHIILVEDHQAGRTINFAEAKPVIAKKLISQAKAPQTLVAIKKAAESGQIEQVDAVLKSAGVTWEKVDDINLGAAQIPRLQDATDALEALAKRTGKTGFIPQLFGSADHHYLIDITSWKDNSKAVQKEDIRKTLSYQKFGEVFEEWFKSIEAKAVISRNPILER
jgi:peptidyl-prolyl cis-trans isomerase D